MKTTVSNYIYDKFNERGMKAFEKKVAKLLKDNGINGNFICHNAYMEWSSRGSYLKVAEIEVNNEIIDLVELTHDSEMYDNWENSTTKDRRNLFLAVLEEKINELKEIV